MIIYKQKNKYILNIEMITKVKEYKKRNIQNLVARDLNKLNHAENRII